MDTNCATVIADLYLFCNERDFMLSLSEHYQAEFYLRRSTLLQDDLLNIDHPYFEQMVSQIYPTDLQLTKANYYDTRAPFFDLDFSKKE